MKKACKTKKSTKRSKKTKKGTKGRKKLVAESRKTGQKLKSAKKSRKMFKQSKEFVSSTDYDTGKQNRIEDEYHSENVTPKKSKKHAKNQEYDENYDEGYPNEDETDDDKRKKKRKKFIITTAAIIGFVFFASLVTVLCVVFLNASAADDGYGSPKPNRDPIHIPDTNLTALCPNILQFSPKTHYFKRKYVLSCVEEFCDSVKLRPSIPLYQQDANKLEFYGYIEPYPSYWLYHRIDDIPDGTLCRNETEKWYGFCMNKVCVKDENITDYDVESIVPINGGWSNDMSIKDYDAVETTLLNITTDQKRIWTNITANQTCKKGVCIPWRLLEYRVCNNPLPSRGGKLCWEDSSPYIQWYDWPLRFGPLCKSSRTDICPDPMAGKSCDENSEEVNCFGHSQLKPNSVLDNNYKFCCLPKIKRQPGRAHPGYGLCIAKTCLPVNFVW